MAWLLNVAIKICITFDHLMILYLTWTKTLSTRRCYGQLPAWKQNKLLKSIYFISIMQFICIVLEWNCFVFFFPGWLPWIGHSPKEVLWSFNFLLLSDLGAIAQSCCFYHCLLSSSNGKWALKVITHHIFFLILLVSLKKKNLPVIYFISLIVYQLHILHLLTVIFFVLWFPATACFLLN